MTAILPPLIVVDFDETFAKTRVGREGEVNFFGWISYISLLRCVKKPKNKENQQEYERYRLRQMVVEKAHKAIEGIKGKETSEYVSALFEKIRELGFVPEEELAERDEFVSRFVNYRVEQLIDNTRSEWPLFHEGALALYKSIINGDIPVDIGIASSNHNAFIRKALEVNGLPPPIIVSSDTLLELKHFDERLYKPSPFSIALINLLRKKESAKIVANPTEIFEGSGLQNANILVVGDNVEKDGGMALKAGCTYAHYPATEPNFIPDPKKKQFLLPSNYRFFQRFLILRRNDLLENRPWNELMKEFMLHVQKEKEFGPSFPEGSPYTSKERF